MDGGGGGIQEGLMRVDGIIVDPPDEMNLELVDEPNEGESYVAGYEVNAREPWRVILVSKTDNSWERRELDCDFRKWLIKLIFKHLRLYHNL